MHRTIPITAPTQSQRPLDRRIERMNHDDGLWTPEPFVPRSIHSAGPSRITPSTSSTETPGSISVIHHVAPASE